MKTAMKRMLDYIQAVQNDNFNSDIEYIKENCIQLLELEKKQIIDTVVEFGMHGEEMMRERGEEYYNLTFKL